MPITAGRAPSLIYRSAAGYELVMRALYGRHYAARLRAVAEQVPHGSTVLELCCGPGTLYDRHLSGRVSTYVGLDANPGFVARLRARGADARVSDLAAPGALPLPRAEVVIIQASLYHFLPDARRILDAIVTAASDCAIVAEPVRNVATSRIPLVAALGRRAADPGVGGHAARFDAGSLAELMAAYEVRRLLEIPGGREHVYVLDGAG